MGEWLMQRYKALIAAAHAEGKLTARSHAHLSAKPLDSLDELDEAYAEFLHFLAHFEYYDTIERIEMAEEWIAKQTDAAAIKRGQARKQELEEKLERLLPREEAA